MTNNRSPQQSPDDDDSLTDTYGQGVADERARCVAVLRGLKVKHERGDLVTKGWNRALDDAIAALEANENPS